MGSSIRRYRVEGGGIPFDKRYDEMTAEEKAAVKALYEKIEPGDEPPFPANGMLSIHDAVSRAQKKLAVTGDLTVVATVSPSGDVLQVKAIGSPSEPMVKFVAAILYRTKFKPAICHGVPCKMDFPIFYRFNLRGP